MGADATTEMFLAIFFAKSRMKRAKRNFQLLCLKFELSWHPRRSLILRRTDAVFSYSVTSSTTNEGISELYTTEYILYLTQD